MLSARIAVLVSGGGTNLQALLDAQDAGQLQSGRIALVLSSRGDARALDRARAHGVRAEAVERRTFPDAASFEQKLLEPLVEERIDIVVLAGFLHILSASFVAHYAGRILNIHPSLIPSFCGRGLYGLKVHKAALDAGVKLTGATVHLVDEKPDGGPILMQQAVAVLPDDTPETLQRRVMKQAEWRLLPEAVERLCRSQGALPPIPPGRGACSPAPPSAFPEGGRCPPSGKVNGVPRGLAPLAGFGAEPRVSDSPFAALLGGNRYPGRGIILGCAPDGRAVLAYFIMGRSAASRGRVLERSGDDLVIRLLSPERVAAPSLILYAPIRVCGEHVVVTNGDQTETVCEALRNGSTFESALRTRRYEPDAPHFTPRISGLLTFAPSGPSEGGPGFGYRLSILKAGGAGDCLRQFFEYEAVLGVGHLIHTYAGDGDPLPSFSGEPRAAPIPTDIEAFSRGLWDALDAENRVALCVRYLTANGTEYEERLLDRHGLDRHGKEERH
ncbi:phosphoribosylglycinamide formyltransferase [uncultured Fretibacterium sp.]|uniref:phosphoribosylglycinamide formyltransferase n=1 Tax=uncultured Fretibacterium sp. TaxID=1678694 RepID=UPI00261173EC|nr:phosphoribosylglycinamide formyltransferase [uncultured Fretibacterium sp.]